MKIETEKDIIELIKQDEWMMNALLAAKQLNLPDWWICAGFVRSKIWDTLHNFTNRTRTPDVDVIYFDRTNLNETEEKRLEEKLMEINPIVPWSVKNEARMHITNGIPPYSSSVDAISKFPETATALGVKLDGVDNLILTAPCGISDVLNLEIKPTSFFREHPDLGTIYNERVMKKNWKDTWSRVKMHYI
ncbi:hypothetical protein CFK37_18200 [Virgibacillus phasianinus]|uniref:Nucleotidyltransferase family protein n=1 Tax=Virgibacillus phasianinus TaxID=2017483 RepID=A0A220U7K0_9BACI|nr:nucleotidyltransferase family protein [Virgibacillus phasianinus]ASK63952.1 hypothetical protein CFK37_18200 [Virgibacillus phasianinus]